MVDRWVVHAVDGAVAENLLERRWFAAHNTAEALRIQCEKLRETKEIAEANWREGRSKLADMEALRDALGSRHTSLLQQGEFHRLDELQ